MSLTSEEKATNNPIFNSSGNDFYRETSKKVYAWERPLGKLLTQDLTQWIRSVGTGEPPFGSTILFKDQDSINRFSSSEFDVLL
ncbi:hypothetical protein TNCV_3967401 [Trichonephila clavipes]|nr:hypothetical protein TNCV_3967401 [Trichonephila clavipes]